MLNSIHATFYSHIDEARKRVGESAPKITNAIIKLAFPRTVREAEIEGCEAYLRDGVRSAVATYIRKPKASDWQLTFNDIEEDVMPYVSDLGAVSYYVPDGVKEGAYVSVSELCHDLDALDKARKFMRLKAVETFVEAKKLDRLFKYLSQRD